MEGVLIRAGSFLLIIVLGYVLKRARFFKPDDYRLVSKIILNVTLPASIAVNFSGTKVSRVFVSRPGERPFSPCTEAMVPPVPSKSIFFIAAA